MMEKENKVGIIILAAGKGTRMKSDKLKVMHELKGQPLIDYVVKSVENLEIKPVVVVCKDNPAVQEYLGERADYAVQMEQLGTGHAVAAAERLLKDKVDQIVVLYGDMPFITTDSIKKLIDRHLERKNTLTLITAIVPDFLEWRANLIDYGRIIRGADGHIVKIVEKKDATPEELAVKEVNPSYICFQADWLWGNLKKLQNDNAQKEYYLTDLVKMAVEDGEKISAITVDPKEVVGINTIEHLETAKAI